MSASGHEPADDDATIVGEVLAGDRERFMELVTRHQHRLRCVLSFYCHSQAELEEFVQEAFVAAFENLARFDPARPFFPWLRGVAINQLRGELRRRRVANDHADAYLHFVQLQRCEEEDSDIEADRQAAALQCCLDELQQDHNEMLTLRYREDRPVAEVAGLIGKTVGATKVALMRLRNILRDCVEKRVAEQGRQV